MIEICNLRNNKMDSIFDVRVDRKSVLGNPFYLRKEEERDEVCDKYVKYFNNKIINDEIFRKEVYRLIEIYKKYGKLRLFCWCYPKRCHAEIIRDFIIDFCA